MQRRPSDITSFLPLGAGLGVLFCSLGMLPEEGFGCRWEKGKFGLLIKVDNLYEMQGYRSFKFMS